MVFSLATRASLVLLLPWNKLEHKPLEALALPGRQQGCRAGGQPGSLFFMLAEVSAVGWDRSESPRILSPAQKQASALPPKGSSKLRLIP